MNATLLVYLLTVTSTTQLQIEYSSITACNDGAKAVAETLDKLNETVTMGYSLHCLLTSEVAKKH